MERRSSLIENSLLLFTCALFAALVTPALFMDGMFMDGVFYAGISRNYAEGLGTFWNQHFSITQMVSMHEQPPLMFFLQGMFFKVLGHSIYTERIYCVVAAIANSVVLLQCWNILSRRNPGEAKTAWLPLFLWVIMPVTFYAFTNNIEECTMTVFVLLAFRSILKALFETPEKNLHWVIAGVWILAAGLTKGVQGMFLLSAPFWCVLLLKNGGLKKFFTRTVLISLIPVLFVIIAWFTPVIHNSFAEYFSSRFGKTFSNVTANSTNHFHILFELLLDTLPTMFVMALFILFGRKTTGFFVSVRENRRLIWFVLACAFSGIIPLMVTLEQRGFYLVTALPLVAIACALMILPAAKRFSEFIRAGKSRAVSFTAIAFVIFIGTTIITITNAGEFRRDEDKILALREAAAITGENVVYGTDNSLGDDWPFITYAQRYHHIAITNVNDYRAQWVFLPKGSAPPANSTQIPLNSTVFELYRK